MSGTGPARTPVPLPWRSAPVIEPPNEAPLIVLGDERYHADSQMWFHPVGHHVRRSTTLAEYEWPTVAASGAVRFALTADIVPTSLRVGFYASRESARAGRGEVVGFEVMDAEGEAAVWRSDAGLDVQVSGAPPGNFVRVSLRYDVAPRQVGATPEHCSATYFLRRVVSRGV